MRVGGRRARVLVAVFLVGVIEESKKLAPSFQFGEHGGASTSMVS